VIRVQGGEFLETVCVKLKNLKGFIGLLVKKNGNEHCYDCEYRSLNHLIDLTQRSIDK
jgi:hypothetical protein